MNSRIVGNDQQKTQGIGNTQTLALIPVGVGLNIALGVLVHTLKLPVYVDAVGTVAITLIAGLRAGVITGVLSFALWGIFNPVYFWFMGTQAMIALYTHFVGRHGGFKSLGRTIVSGIGLGIVAGIVSAPVIVKLFGGITGSGPSVVAAFLLASGKRIVEAVVTSGLACEPIDKALQCLLAVWLLKGLPKSLTSRFHGGALRQNGL